MKKKKLSNKKSAIQEAREIASTLYAQRDNYIATVCELITYAKDGSSERRLAQLAKAVNFSYGAARLAKLLEGVR